MGTLNLNESLQSISNPQTPGKMQLQVGSRTIRVGDRVTQIDTESMSCEVLFSGGEDRLIAF